MDAEQSDSTDAHRRHPGSGYDQEERAYSEWMHRFVERLAQHMPAQAFPRLMPIASYWARHARHMDPDDAAQAAALWCCPEAATSGEASCEEAASMGGEFAHLCQLEQCICVTSARIARQERLVERMAARRCNTSPALALLDQLNQTLEALARTRATVLLRWGWRRGAIIEIRH
jgi:hypothetical protein